MDESEKTRLWRGDSATGPAPAIFGGTEQGMPVEDDPVDVDVFGEDADDAARHAAGADPATRDAFGTAASNPNVISPPD